MAKRGRPRKLTAGADMAAASGNGKPSSAGTETTSEYFRRIFKENPKWLGTKSNDEVLRRWLADHPGYGEMPQNVKNHLSNLKSVLRKKNRKKIGRPKKVVQAAPV